MSTTLEEQKKAEQVEKAAAKDEGSKPIQSDQDRAAFSVSPQQEAPRYD